MEHCPARHKDLQTGTVSQKLFELRRSGHDLLEVIKHEQEGLLASNRQFVAILHQRQLRYEFHTTPGGHNWDQWNKQIEGCFRRLMEQLQQNAAQTTASKSFTAEDAAPDEPGAIE